MPCLTSRPAAEIARQLRAALRREFSGHLTDFSVRSQSSPALIRARWCGGPEEEEVERVVGDVTSGTWVAAIYAGWALPVSPPWRRYRFRPGDVTCIA